MTKEEKARAVVESAAIGIVLKEELNRANLLIEVYKRIGSDYLQDLYLRIATNQALLKSIKNSISARIAELVGVNASVIDYISLHELKRGYLMITRDNQLTATDILLLSSGEFIPAKSITEQLVDIIENQPNALVYHNIYWFTAFHKV